MSDALPYAEVIGDPIEHSKSPLIHNFWLNALDIEAEYRKTHVTPEGMAAYFLMRRSDPDWLGCNVTIPHKIAVLDFVDDPGGVRERIGAVNTIASETGGPLIGTNTDAGGFLQPLLRDKWKGQSAVIIGTGGAARAILFALTSLGVPDITIMARDAARGQALLDHGGTKGRVIGMGDALPAADLLVNSTSLGMVGQPLLDLDLTPLPESATVYDIVYAPLETGLLKAARARGLKTLDGLEMLIGQAALAFDIFFDAQAPRELDAELRALLVAAEE
ncbi:MULTISPECIES: shikimate dehydrogenase [Sphingobium]|jgi:shikimate dehydrogenase|uniref:Shikimate dehydrogenase (NADP(+)) n=1 Tax=Sphingobium limneticum TaxID=1007511 RepID=A0A5J5HY85_9SPHN|nr:MULTISPECIES: shikimate dehydrogenase [Sphingobium]MBU0933383.1 shikimate dehydrogenase [Alphaproteobacteria bacterium]KAA9013743.1 shikimate dehydrogenase [Sphingobium limneticum]KAA9017177.1 shikimate dehydrogenase [Sphingobium limneticum]KAA9026821.1 shikimate dehydrogenase [Sphingobium limneticum]BBD01324.1 shikimate dehydrogenase [Sphingobium sp. YG1]